MGYMKHVFGESMTSEEIERLEHAELVHMAACFSAQLVGRALRIYHDRFYGTIGQCRWCDEPNADRRAASLDRLDAAFQRPAAEPPSVAEPDLSVHQEIHAAIEAILIRRLGSNRGFAVNINYSGDRKGNT